jgi:hypothetical protein
LRPGWVSISKVSNANPETRAWKPSFSKPTSLALAEYACDLAGFDAGRNEEDSPRKIAT